MKYLAFIVLGLILLFEGCCNGGDYNIGNYYKTKYYRKIKLTDTTDRIIKIRYKNSDKVFYSNDTIAELVISENTENTLFIETKHSIDTIVLRVEIKYNYNNSECDRNGLSKKTIYTPKIVNHTFQNAVFYFQSVYENNSYYSKTEYDILTITP